MKVDFDKTIPVTGNFYIGWKIWYGAKASSETRQFAVYQSPDRIIASDNSAWFLKNGIWLPFTQHPRIPGSFSLDVKVITTGNSVVNKVLLNSERKSEFSLFPNPAGDYITISSENVFGLLEANLFDMTGRKVLTFNLDNKFPGEFRLNIATLQRGIYNLILSNKTHFESVKILKIN